MLSYSTLPEPKIGTADDIARFRQLALGEDSAWKVVIDKLHKDGVKVWTRHNDYSPIDTVRLFYRFKGLKAEDLYDTLHDDIYRLLWDDSMIEGYEIERLGPFDDVGYYAAKLPGPVNNRDFCNQRTWFVSPDKQEYLIFNHSVKHPQCPPKDGFIRAISFDTGYHITVSGDDCEMRYVGTSNPVGWIPSWLINSLMSKYAPNVVQTLDKAARGYSAWKSENDPNYKPWYGVAEGDSEEEEEEEDDDNDSDGRATARRQFGVSRAHAPFQPLSTRKRIGAANAKQPTRIGSISSGGGGGDVVSSESQSAKRRSLSYSDSPAFARELAELQQQVKALKDCMSSDGNRTRQLEARVQLLSEQNAAMARTASLLSGSLAGLILLLAILFAKLL